MIGDTEGVFVGKIVVGVVVVGNRTGNRVGTAVVGLCVVGIERKSKL